jgi:regulator of protease activity HflC (stomatin/prohibitin superfamily)
MKTKKITSQLIKNIALPSLETDFRSHAFALFILVLLLAAGIGVQLYLTPGIEILYIVYVAAGALVASAIIIALPQWSTVIKFIAAGWLIMFAWLDKSYVPLFSFISAGFLFSPCFQLAQHWEKTVILRFGKFKRLKGPGLFLILPLIERVAHFVDTRIRSTDFSAETTLTKDTVPVHVDAIAFWMIWDAKKAVLEVENFMDAVILSAQTALRDAIGKHDLATLLSERDRLGKEIQQILEQKTNPWGITILSIEIRDIVIPKELEDAMSRQAQAERERQSRVILGTAEVEISEKFEKAAQRYQDNPTALHLRALNMIYEGLRKNGSIILLPSDAVQTMSLGSVLGTAAFDKTQKLEKKPRQGGKPEIPGGEKTDD